MLDHKLQKCMFKVNMFLFTLLYPNKYWQLFIRKYFSMYLLLQLIDYLAAFDGLLSENKRKEVSRLNRRCIGSLFVLFHCKCYMVETIGIVRFLGNWLKSVVRFSDKKFVSLLRLFSILSRLNSFQQYWTISTFWFFWSTMRRDAVAKIPLCGTMTNDASTKWEVV